MKKQFFYAAMALAVMSSCSNDDALLGNDIPTTEYEGKSAIELGINSPQATIGSRAASTGTVGSMDDAKNLWQGQDLYVIALDETDALAISEETKEYIFKDLLFEAPTQSSAGASDKTIKIMKDAETIKHVYYNTIGNLKFYGFHVDSAFVDNTNWLNNYSIADKTVSNIKINGSQDLLGAKTKEISKGNYSVISNLPSTEQNALIPADDSAPTRGFSAWAARRGIQPILDFKHLLTRFTFNVVAADTSAAQHYYDYTGKWTPNTQDCTLGGGANDQNTGVFVDSIVVRDIKTEMKIVLDGTDSGKTYPYAESTGTAMDSLFLMSKGTTHMEKLVPIAPMMYAKSSDATAAGSAWTTYATEKSITGFNFGDKTPVGESLMLPAATEPTQKFVFMVYVSQWVKDTEKTDNSETTWRKKTGHAKAELDFSKVELGSVMPGPTSFQAGYSFAINITVHSFQEIKITAELTPWLNGGDINFDAE